MTIIIVVAGVIFLLAAKLTAHLMLPTFSDRVTVEATGEKNPESLGADLGVTSIHAGGKNLDLNGTDIERGSWSHNGVALTWDYTENHAFSFMAPCYADVKIEFIQNIWAGKARVMSRGAEDVLDLYSPDTSSAVRTTYTLARAKGAETARRLFPTALLLVLEALACFALVRLWIKKAPELSRGTIWKGQRWMKRLSIWFWLRLLVVVIAFVIMWRFAGRWSLWADDLATLDFVAENVPLSTNIARILDEAKYNPPLFYIFAYFWLRIAPYGTVALKLPSILFSCAGIWFCGTGAKRIAGNRAALIATVFASASYFLISHAAYTFRCYGLMFLLCALLIISYHKRLTEPEKIRHYISYGLLHALLLYTCYICGLITAILGLYDIWLFARKKVKPRFLWSYVGAGAAFLPLILYVLRAMIESHANFWPDVPNLKTLTSTVLLVFGNQVFLLALFLLAAVFVFAQKRDLLRCHKVPDAGLDIMIALILWCVFVIGFSYVFSRYLYPNSSIFVGRYFISVLAPAVVAAAIGMERVLVALCEGHKKASSDFLTCAALLICYVCLEYNCLATLRSAPGTCYETYEQATDWICAQEDAYQGRCVVMMTGYQGGLYYYATQGGRRPNLNFGGLNEQNWVDYDVVYVSPQHGGIDAVSQTLLDTYYEEADRRDDLNVVKYCRKQEEGT